ncbi:MAG TPA: hypothetical protein VM686_10280 [Polyangiaceae bacterium]|jgi:hypothetical protein|nr:hypothetical protein [Polyangiaceae bacterium]
MTEATRAFFAREDVRAFVDAIRAEFLDAQFCDDTYSSSIDPAVRVPGLAVYSPALDRYVSASIGAMSVVRSWLDPEHVKSCIDRLYWNKALREGRAYCDEDGEPIAVEDGASAFFKTETVEISAHGVKSLGLAKVMPLTVSSNEQAEELFGKGSVLSKPFKEGKPKPDPYAEHRQKEERLIDLGGPFDTSGGYRYTERGAKSRAENRALFGHVPAKFSADVVPGPRETFGAHPWECGGEDEP